jgi:hypothetical protein
MEIRATAALIFSIVASRRQEQIDIRPPLKPLTH